MPIRCDIIPPRCEHMKFTAKYFSELTLSQLYEILRSRSEVFMLEQRIICQDMDGVDRVSRHCFLEDNDRVVAYLRAFYADETQSAVQIGRVLTLQHGMGLGRKLMEASILDLKENLGCKKICLHSQKQAVGFYEKLGFQITSEEFLEEGIPHVTMELEVK